MTTRIKFKEFIITECKAFKFTELYDEIDINMRFLPSELANIIQCTIYFMSFKHEPNSDIMSFLGHHLNILTTVSPIPLNKMSLLNIISLCDSEINKHDSMDNIAHMYY